VVVGRIRAMIVTPPHKMLAKPRQNQKN